jgi:hypothetical protein
MSCPPNQDHIPAVPEPERTLTTPAAPRSAATLTSQNRLNVLSGSTAGPAPVREELLAHLKGEQIEPPAWDRVRRIIGAALRQAEQALTARIASRIPAEAVATR